MPQLNSDDCGVFTSMYVSQLACDSSVNLLAQADVPSFRAYMALCLLRHQYTRVLVESLGGGPLTEGERCLQLI